MKDLLDQIIDKEKSNIIKDKNGKLAIYWFFTKS